MSVVSIHDRRSEGRRLLLIACASRYVYGAWFARIAWQGNEKWGKNT